MANLGYIQVTRQCNQKCAFCSNPPTEKKRTLSFFKKIIDFYIKEKYDGVILSGGEPTLCPHLAALISYASENRFSTRVITNGQRTADLTYLTSLKEAGLRHVHLSVYSDDPGIQSRLTGNPGSLGNIVRSLENFQKLGIVVGINTVINKLNADHLSRIVKWILSICPSIDHFVWNNLDPLMAKGAAMLETTPRLIDFELELFQAMSLLHAGHKTFRVERVPLCYMADFGHCSTETRKIVKNEERMVYFLDDKNLFRQKKWAYGKASCCAVCGLNGICAGLYQMDKFYSSAELYPLFVSKDEIIAKIRRER